MQIKKPTINGIFVTRGTFNNRDIAYLYRPQGGRWVQVFWAQAVAVAREIGLGLEKEDGIKKGDRVAILSSVRPDWSAADHGILSIGAVTVGLYDSLSSEQVAFILNHSGARVLFVENQALLDKVASVADRLTSLERVYAFDEVKPTERLPLGDFMKMRKRGDKVHLRDQQYWQNKALAVEPEDLATLVYTSGTTGDPKAVMLTHGNLWYVVDTVGTLIPFESGTRSLCYLPLAHILQRYAVYLGEWHGVYGYYSNDIKGLAGLLAEVRPTKLAAVPRILEKIHDRIQDEVEKLSDQKRTAFKLAMHVGKQVSQRKQQKRFLPPWLMLQNRIAEKLVFSKLKEKLGGQLSIVVSGGAPLSPAISEFFHALGILVIEGYGLSETSAPVATNTPNDYRFGTVGKAIPGTEITLAPDGEILVKGPGVFKGYFGSEEATRDAFTPEGFFRTGDLGEFVEGGYLRITGRKKEIIVTSGGKNVAPAYVEDLLTRSRYIAQAVVVGDQRSYITALILPDVEAVTRFAKEKGLAGEGEALFRQEAVMNLLNLEISAANAPLSRPEMVRRWDFLKEEMTVESDQLTPTLKVRRGVVIKKNQGVIDGLYAGKGMEVV